MLLFTYVFPSDKVKILQLKLILQAYAIGGERIVLLHTFT